MLAAAFTLAALVPVSAQADNNKLIVKYATGTSNVFVVTDSGSIGIGVSCPIAGIHLAGSAYPYATVKAKGNPTSGGRWFLGYNNRPGGLHLDNDRLVYFLFGTTSNNKALHATGMTVLADRDWTMSSTPAYF
jgi:hypothetical protein